MTTFILRRWRSRVYGLLAAAVILFILTSFSSSYAQPDGYCSFPGGDYQYYYCYSYYAYFTDVQLTKQNTGEVSFRRTSGDDGCYTMTNVEGDVRLGSTYTLSLKRYNNYYYNTCRVFVDFNMDGDFNDPGEYLSYTYTYGYYTYMTDNVTISFPCSTKIGKTRLRVMTYYYYPYSYEQGRDACLFGYAYPPYYAYGYGECEDYILNIIPDIESTFPTNGSILYANEPYDGTSRLKYGNMVNFKKPSVTLGSTQPAGAILKYKIVGPLPSSTTVYEGLDPVTGSTDIDMGGYQSYTIQRSRGAFSVNNDGTFKADKGGEYRVVVNISGAGCPGDVYQTFTVAWTNDLSAREIVSPRTNLAPKFYKYLRGNNISVTGAFINTGVTNVNKFDAWAIIIAPNGTDTVYNQRVTYDVDRGQQAVRPGQKVEVSFPSFRNSTVGIYKMYLNCDLLSAIDQEDYNDHIPRQGDAAYTFEIQHEIQLQANKLIEPVQGDEILANRPFIPVGEFRNVGVGDASDIPAKLIVKKMPSGIVAYESNVVVPDIPSGTYNTRSQSFDAMALQESGSYQACLVITHPDDTVRVDDTTCVTFTVVSGLQGTYTVGLLNINNPRNFPTIDSAMNALYYRGLAGPVTFELTDDEYTVESKRPDQPAWDFTTTILNSGYAESTKSYNTITWKPSADKARTRGSVVINLNSANGKGIVFGQSINPANEYSIFNSLWSRPSLARRYSVSKGFITFDGGSQKALRFVVKSNSKAHASAFYLQRGSDNILIKNVLIENGTSTLSKNIWMPMTAFNPSDNTFSFQADTLNSAADTYSYSAGIVMRSAPVSQENASLYKLDTLVNTNNTLEGNEISGFGYGIVSLGLGELLVASKSDYSRFYNNHNNIRGNIIHDVYRAGIYIGYEENSNIVNNRIFALGNNDIAASGIIAGGDESKDFKGYNNVGLNISGNEISAVISGVYASGIKVEQSANIFPHPTKTQVTFPDVPENMKIANNVVWGLSATTTSANRVGIHLLTGRNGSSLTEPKVTDYNTRSDKIVNNTVIVGIDAGALNTGMLAGIAIQQSAGAQLFNNAIAILDNDADPSANIFAAVFYEGASPKDGGLTADRNAFWMPSGAPASVYRFIETGSGNNIIDPGTRDDYKSLSQWQVWTGQDRYSVFGDFTGDLSFTGSDPNKKLRIKMNPNPPVGSILDNRGEKISWNTEDIDGHLRGPAGQRYDIGAFEFSGGLWVTDLEVSAISSPWVYKATYGTFADAEYVMSAVPVEVKALIRNNGSMDASAANATVKIFRETTGGIFSNTPEIEQSVRFNASPTQTIEASFNLADGQDKEFVPKSYTDLSPEGYIIPQQFRTMQANVTPLYKIVVSLESDQNNDNNSSAKIVRFYIPRSAIGMVVSAENSMTKLDANSSPDEIAGRVNFDSLMLGLNKIGWLNMPDSSRYDLDIFDRLGWEPKTVNYRMYRTLVWSDGGDKPLTRFQRSDIRNYLSDGFPGAKKNLIIGSQEMVRANENADKAFVRDVLGAIYRSPGNPLGEGVSNNGNSIKGAAIGIGMTENILSTKYPGDEPPYAGLMAADTSGSGLALSAYYYSNHSAARNDSIAGIAATTMNHNVSYVAVDWRHYEKVDRVLRQEIDFIEKNGGVVIPVELISFNAQARDKRVEVSWSTASEINSDRFEVERAEMINSLKGSFEKIASESAAGKSAFVRNYGPVVDKNVEQNHTYFYRLRMFDKDGTSKLSAESVAVLTGSHIAGQNVGVHSPWLSEVNPNPAEGEAKLDYFLPQAGAIEIAIYDMAGRKLMTVASGMVESGSHDLRLNVSGLASGTYTLLLSSDSGSVTRQLTVVR